MIGLLHGYLLEGSGSNLWTRSIVQALCRDGRTVHLVCQENRPEPYDFIAQAWLHTADGQARMLLDREVPYPGRCILHRPELGPTLPVYVRDRYEAFERVVPMVDLADAEIEAYLARNVEVVTGLVRDWGISVLHANHAVPMSVVAHRVRKACGVPFAIMPHGSAIEYAVRPDPRFRRMGAEAFEAASRIFLISREMRERVLGLFDGVSGLERKMKTLNLGVDTDLFRPLDRNERAASIDGLAAALAGTPRGKRATQSEQLIETLPQRPDKGAVLAAIAAAARYEGLRPDDQIEAALDGPDWSADRTVLFVGRLIESKGLQSVLAALPDALAAEPRLRLIVVGHGPLREAMELFVWAMEQGRVDWIESLVAWGAALEGRDEAPLAGVAAYIAGLRSEGRFETWVERARRYVRRDRVVFTGYLNHRELCRLFPCCDAAVFPSVVAEAGPLVFLEALASGCFPLGTYFAGMAASIDAVAERLSSQQTECMKLDPDPARTIADIAARLPRAVAVDGDCRETLRALAVERYDWKSVAARLADDLSGLLLA